VSMSSRARVLAALNRQESDRVPLDVGVTGIAPGAYTQLREQLGVEGDPARAMDVLQMLAWVEQPVVEALETDSLKE